jgi:formate dehydrogenase maturation protein FdhE
MITVTETESVQPVCPHCGEPITEVFAHRMQTTFGVRFIYICSLCKKVLGISHRKGFWMG